MLIHYFWLTKQATASSLAHWKWLTTVKWPLCTTETNTTVKNTPPQVVHQLESFPHVRLVEGVHPSIHCVLLRVCGGAVWAWWGRCGHQTGKTWEAVSGSLEIDGDPTVRQTTSWFISRVFKRWWDKDNKLELTKPPQPNHKQWLDEVVLCYTTEKTVW